MSIDNPAVCDGTTTIEMLRQRVESFVSQRDWHQFHSPKNLSMSLAIEAAELMEHFQWITTDDSRRIPEDDDKLQQVAEELADVLCYVLAMSNELRIDLSKALVDKMSKNEEKYPVETYRGRYGDEDLK